MTQELRLIGMVGSEISFIQDNAITLCKIYREAVRLSWECKKNKGMTKAELTKELMQLHELISLTEKTIEII